ncbi:hypothetical protein UFOVP80_53 [uncultured Caudovirales phage]|jgi:hypothetical protein|uniref:Uncharacterized protein n=1 Tax=uncultured Caudovirales phage TaxID=2100421 RepID=A0A6J5KW40_9CAUD|nr:hypothetical protein UFOVP80_53 [uncultured Caudovirales phage]
MSIELTVIVKDAERTLKKKFLVYEAISLVVHDPVIDKCLQDVLTNFNGEPEDVVIRATMVCK